MRTSKSSRGWRVLAYLSVIMAIILGVDILGFSQSQNSGARPDRGVRPNGSYAISDIENVGLTNGNLNLSIPLAGLPPIAGGRLSLGLSATYNSKLWDSHQDEARTDGQPPNVRYANQFIQPSEDGGWQISGAYAVLFDTPTPLDFDWLGPEVEDPDFNFFLQKPYTQWTKVMLHTPNGAVHELRPNGMTPYGVGGNAIGNRDFLNGYYWETPDKLNDTMTYYSFDGSFIWAKINTSSSNIKWEVFLPDGTRIVQRTL